MEERSAALAQLRDMQARLQRADAAINGDSKATASIASTLRPPRPLLTIFTLFFEQDPTIQLTFPCPVDPLWPKLAVKRRVTKQAFSPELLYQEVLSGVPVTTTPWVVLSSMHTTEPLVVHAEELRHVMMEVSSSQPHCVVDMNGFSVDGRQYWRDWEYQTILQQRASIKQNFEDNAKFSAARKGTWGSSGGHAFPGELLRPLRR
ncbi:Hypothetical protein, putative [Bodo saltans]|uniref:Uncharacterized protein n=1 Tax=Bodo saltans TaxID=75058 RepID=A0A0S4ILY5_BODSA|nr:Hypothetical protein, putative [Bodo saltans]|eukprot:CUF34129.1 Hypothetical protein, putative [Bodo saltans]